MTPRAPLDNLYRGLVGGVALSTRADGEGDDAVPAGSLLHGHFTVWDTWTPIDSWYEGRFLERIVKGSAKKSIRDRGDQIKCQFDHGYDSFVGGAPLGPFDDLREDDLGIYYEVPLLDTDYNRDRILPLLQGRTIDGRMTGSLLGASFRFRILREEWVEPDEATPHNPEKLPERTIREIALYEGGPVVFGAYPTATAKVRCLTDHYLDRQRERARATGAPPPVGEHGPEGFVPNGDGLVLASGHTFNSTPTPVPSEPDLRHVDAGDSATSTDTPVAPATEPPDGPTGRSLTALRIQILRERSTT